MKNHLYKASAPPAVTPYFCRTPFFHLFQQTSIEHHNTQNATMRPTRAAPGTHGLRTRRGKGRTQRSTHRRIAHLSGYQRMRWSLCGTLQMPRLKAKRQRRRKSGAIVIRWRSTPGQRTRPGERPRQPARHHPIANLSG